MTRHRPPDATDDALVTLWERARRVALRRCARTLARLSAGEGGFYGADDLMQDLFLEFWALLRRHHGRDGPELWQAWERVLWGGGLRVLRRKPQRLWARRERAVSPEMLEVADRREDDEPALGACARRSLVVGTDGTPGSSSGDALDDLEDALWRLRPLQRQVLYLLALRGVPADEIARRLGLGSADAVYQRARRARRALGESLDAPRGCSESATKDEVGGE